MSDLVRRVAMNKWLIGMLAFFNKEVNEVRRQPRLFLLLIGGPFLVMVIFGATFANSLPMLRTILVLPFGELTSTEEQEVRRLAGLNFALVDVTFDRAAALARLETGDIEVVQIVPANIRQRVARGEQPRLAFLTRMIDPMREGWVQYLAYAETSEVNRLLLQQQTSAAQSEAASVKVRLANARGIVAELSTELDPTRLAMLVQQLQPLKRLVIGLREGLPKIYLINVALQERMAQLMTALANIETGLSSIERAILSGTLHRNMEAIRSTLEDMVHVEALLDIFISTPPEQIVSPVQRSYLNLRGEAFRSVIFYAPAVVALLVQHLAVTLGALALVRERLMGTYDIFRVAPLGVAQMVLGKYLSYVLFVAATAIVLQGLLLLIGVPLSGSLVAYLGLLFLLATASLGYGFLISAVVQSDSQAVQLSMLALLLSIFFSGLFINLENFSAPAHVVSALIPMTHGVAGFTDVLLKGLPPQPGTWLALLALSLATFTLVMVMLRRQFRRA